MRPTAITPMSWQRTAFPERLFASAWGIAAAEPIALPRDQEARLRETAAAFEEAKLPPIVGWSVSGGGALLALIMFVLGFRRIGFKRCVENLPTTKTAGAAYGLSEFKGIVTLADQEEPLSGPLSMRPCVEYHYVVKERRRSGKNRSR